MRPTCNNDSTIYSQVRPPSQIGHAPHVGCPTRGATRKAEPPRPMSPWRTVPTLPPRAAWHHCPAMGRPTPTRPREAGRAAARLAATPLGARRARAAAQRLTVSRPPEAAAGQVAGLALEGAPLVRAAARGAVARRAPARLRRAAARRRAVPRAARAAHAGTARTPADHLSKCAQG